jgi:thioredoxin reductase
VEVASLSNNSLTAENPVDIIIIGGGPAGLFAAFYGGMRQASVKLIESMPQLGGQLAALYPEKYIYDVAGFPKVTAQELVDRLKEQLDHFKPEICLEEKVTNVIKHDERLFEIITDKTKHYAKAVIITAGVGAFEPRRLELPEAARFEKKNLHYFVGDLQRFKGQKVLVSGGGDSAVDWSLMLEPIAESVTLIHRRDKFRAHEHSVENLNELEALTCLLQRKLQCFMAKSSITIVTLSDVKTAEATRTGCGCRHRQLWLHFFARSDCRLGYSIFKAARLSWILVWRRILRVSFAAGDVTTYPGKLKLIAVGFGEAPTAINNAKVYVDPSCKAVSWAQQQHEALVHLSSLYSV